MENLTRSPRLLDMLAKAIVRCSVCDGAGIDSGWVDSSLVDRIAADLHGVADAAFERVDSLAMSDIEQGGDGLRTAMAELKCNIDELSVLESPLWGTVPASGKPSGVVSLCIWDNEKASGALVDLLARALERLGEPRERVEILFKYELRGLFAQARALRARERSLGGQQVEAWRHGVEAHALFILIAPLMAPLLPVLRASVDASLSQAVSEAYTKGAKKSGTSLSTDAGDFIKLLATCDGGFHDAIEQSPYKQAAQNALLCKSPFFLHVDVGIETGGGILTANERAKRKKNLREYFSEGSSPIRPKEGNLRALFTVNWSAIIDGEWVAIKRERWGLLRLMSGLGKGNSLYCVDSKGKNAPFEVGEDGVQEILRGSLARQEMLRAIELNYLFDPSLDDREIEAFRSALLDFPEGSGANPLEGNLSLRGLPVWLSDKKTGALLDWCREYLEIRYDLGVVRSLIEDVAGKLSRYRDARSSRMDEDFADAVTALVVAFFWSPKKALDRRADRMTTDANADLVFDALTPLSSVKPLVLSVPSASVSVSRPYYVTIEPRLAQLQTAAVRCVLGRSTAKVAIDDTVRMERDGESGAYRMVSTFAEQMRPCLDAVVSAAQAEGAPAKSFGTAGLDDVRNAEQWHESGNGWMLLPGDQGVSGVHVAIVQADGSWWCADAGSHNGTVIVRALRDEGPIRDSCGPLGAPVRVFCLEGRVRNDGTRGGGKFFTRVERRLRGAGFAFDSTRAAAVRLRYGDVILLGDHTEVRVACL